MTTARPPSDVRDHEPVAWEEDFGPEAGRSYRNVILRDPEGNEFCLGGGSVPA